MRRFASGSVLRVGGGALQPDVTAFEMLVLPDRHDLLHPLDGVAARCERVDAVRRGGDVWLEGATADPDDEAARVKAYRTACA